MDCVKKLVKLIFLKTTTRL